MQPVAVAYLGSHFLSLLGNGIAAVALPLIVLQDTGSPLSVGAVATATAVPALLVGLCAGIVIDRVNRRSCSMASDAVSAVAVAAIPLVDLLWGLNLWWFVALAVAGSFGDVPGMTARQVLVPAVAQHTGVPLERMVSLRQMTTSTALVIGPAAAGGLLTLFGGTAVLLVTAATSGAAVLLTVAIPHRVGRIDTTPVQRTSVWAQVGAGAAVLHRSRLLTGTVALTVGLALVLGGLQGLVLPVYFSLIARPDLLGFVLTALAVGMLIGTGTFGIIGAKIPRRRWMAAALIGTAVGFVLIATLASPAVVFAGAAVLGVAVAVQGAIIAVVQAERIPDDVRGRVLSLQNTCLLVAAPVGVGLAGVVAEYGSLLAAGMALTALWLGIVTALARTRADRPRTTGESLGDNRTRGAHATRTGCLRSSGSRT